MTKTYPNLGEPKLTGIQKEIPHRRGRRARGRKTVPTCQRDGFQSNRRWLRPKEELRTNLLETVNQAVKDPGATLLSWGFGPFSALVRRSDLHRACLTRLCCTLRLSQPLSALFLSCPFRPCFMPVALLGFWTLQSFPLLKIGSPFGFPSRPGAPPNLSTPTEVTATRRPPEQGTRPCSGVLSGRDKLAARLHGFDPFKSPFIRHPVLPVRRSRCSPGFGPLQGALLFVQEDGNPPQKMVTHLLPLAYEGRTSPKKVSTWYPRVSKNEEVGVPRKRGGRPCWGVGALVGVPGS
jgi:hypothetical protein